MKNRFWSGKYVILRRSIILLLFTAFCCLPFYCFSEIKDAYSFSVQRIGQMICYKDNAFLVQAPESGLFSVTISDSICTYRVIREQIPEGITEVHWDGCGYNGERLDTKRYYFDFRLESCSGNTYSFFFESPVVDNAQHLQFVLPSSETAYLGNPAGWFVETKAIRDGGVVFEFYNGAEDKEPARRYEKAIHAGRVEHYTLESLSGRNMPETGEYTVRVYERSREDEAASFSLKILPGNPDTLPISVTGEIMPDPDAEDSEIWQAMMRPSVVVDIDPMKHQNIYADADAGSKSLGTLHGQTQGLKVIEISGEWAKIGAWNHEDASYVEGWVPLNRLKVVEPDREYGLLIDKKKQTMSVFRQGKRIETLLVSTGRAEENHFDRETAAGCFLTGLHRVDFSTQGLKYDFVIQYDGGNLLHQIPYSSDGKRDFTKGIIYLGTKASHACIRIQNHPGDQSGINAYWIWTHIPYRTRVIILDDPEECAAEKARLSGSAPVKRESFISCGDSFSDDAIVITFAGDVIPVCSGDSLGFDAYFRKYGAGYMLGGLRELFEKDDLTSLSLACVLKEDTSGSIKMRGLPEYAEIFENNSVEMISLGDEHLYDYREGGYEATVSAIGNKVLWTGQNHSQTVMIKGTIFGFATCSEKDYQVDTGIIGQKIRELRDKGCEYVIMQCHWGNEKDIKYGKNQEAMARACVREGADLVIGRHPDAVQGIGDIDGVPVIYSLGRLVVDRTVRRKTYDSLAVQAAFYPHERKKTEIRLIPLFSSSSVNEKANDCRPVPAENTEKKRILEMIQADTGFEITESDKP